MNTDFRIEVGFFDHHKTRRLIASLGLPAAWSLMRLWEFATVNKPDGKLRGMTPEEIASASHYQGDPEEFIAELGKIRFINREYSHGVPVFSLHDWEEHQPFVVNAPSRREAARKAAESRWKGRKKADASHEPTGTVASSINDAERIRGASSDADRNATRNAPAFLPSSLPERTPLPPTTPNSPPSLPSPLPSGGDRTRNRTGDGWKRSGAYVEPAGARPKLDADGEARLERYRIKRTELEREIRANHPGMPDGEVLTLVSAELKRQGITA